MKVYQGRAWVFPANVTTDEIIPGKYLDRANHEVGEFAMSGIDPGFVKKIKQGDLIVAGSNFGSGSGRETAPIAIQLAGISAVIAPSFARIFFRNSINIGLPAVIIDTVEDIKDGDEITLDLINRVVKNARTKKEYPTLNLNGTSMEILKAGGIIPFTKQRMKHMKNSNSGS